MAVQIEPPYYPIIFVRGYAGSQHAIEEAVGDPYMGLNLGSTRLRQLWTGDVVQYFFESPLVRLMKELGYRDVFDAGAAMGPGREIPPRCVIIHRYYDAVSRDFGWDSDGEIESYAHELARLILRVRDRVCGDDAAARAKFKVYLVAHSMGGLICRSFLQNAAGDPSGDGRPFNEARTLVDKVFTYATPHNGVELRLIGNVPGFLSASHADNFNRDRMCAYLGLDPSKKSDVATLDGKFDPDRFFCLVGTNERDYEVAMGVSRRAVGPMSDGLVRIANASVHGPWPAGGPDKQAPRAFVHRSHSGAYGIVNSEEGYQNLKRFFYGDVRIDGILEVQEITLPPDVQRKKEEGKAIRASYHFETVVRVRGAQWDLHRRLVSEGSAIFVGFDDMFPTTGGIKEARRPHLFSAFLWGRERVNTRRASLGFSVDLGVLVPQYEIDGKLLFDQHFEGGYLYRDKVNLEAIPPGDKGEKDEQWALRYGFDSRTPNRATTAAPATVAGDRVEFRIPIEQLTRPGIRADLVLTARPWA
jgi:hypothetical protein